ncbi:transcription cofactor vestigial-like protein 3 [Anguilla anguilla]|uniref:transcription cofactor vestigial-like protein 3 n=1 Tax=Anguilla anguilla TaxID=7936 RepID=UPI0015A9E7EF|nr:transcription cofactor vestigial-like protein 3 [Anguilla anguilla]
MSRLDVVYRQGYGAHRYLPATSAAAAAVAYNAAYFHRQQQTKLCSHSRMQESTDLCSHGKQTQAREQEERRGVAREQAEQGGVAREQAERRGVAKELRPAEAEYLSSRCVLFTYFQGDIGDEVDEHFSRALSQPSVLRAPPGALWREGGRASGQCSGFPSPLWGTACPPQGSPRLSSLHPEFSPSRAFQSPEPAAWAGHGLPQPGVAPPPAAPADSWHYSLGPQGGAGYPHMHNMYPHVHARHAHHHMLHHGHSPALEARFGPLLLPGVRPPGSPAPSCEGRWSEPDAAAHGWPASFHGSVDIYESALDQTKVKAPVWF